MSDRTCGKFRRTIVAVDRKYSRGLGYFGECGMMLACIRSVGIESLVVVFEE